VSELAAKISAQAKLNLHLRIFVRDASGYHPLETIFHRIDLCDDLTVEVLAKGKTLDVDGEDLGPVEKNLAWRAAESYAAHNGWPKGFRISLKKRIPTGAGMGGGSADAAAVLRALNSLSPDPLAKPALLRLAAKIGSDVPFLASDSVMALAWGRGERMLSLPPLPRYDILLMSPAFGVSTADAYRWLDEDRAKLNSARAEMVSDDSSVDSIALESLSLSTWTAIAMFARNDFEAPVAARHPEIREYLDRLRNSRAIFAQMTGSGSTLFCVLDSPPNYAKVPPEHRDRVTTTKTSIDVVQPVRVG
jgi:4-diphosphocytidyl-2-C-methyl-D-erythritol kinase